MQDCDLIMKGGVTSGVVYPHAIRTIAKDYRLRSIGGTSAGAIAASFAAAAEYRRQVALANDNPARAMAGFDKIDDVAEDLGSNLLRLFQPAVGTRPLFAVFVAAIDKKRSPLSRVGRALVTGFENQLWFALLCVALTVLAGVISQSWWAVAAGLVLSLVLTLIAVLAVIWRGVRRDLPQYDFGMCTGKTTPDGDGPAFGDWVDTQIDAIAQKTDAPLTVGDLAKYGIKIATVTTDLSSGRPYRLPLQTNIHWFSRAEFARLFSPRMVDYLCAAGGARKPLPSDTDAVPKDLFALPSGDAFPVYLVARMSLSFPGLISGVPLWRADYLEDGRLRRCLFSDGGISSNFPVHFFDSFLPDRPTFGIALGDFVPAQHGTTRVDLPQKAPQSSNLPITDIVSVGGFAGAILHTAKGWQDTMQSLLPGHAERIVTVRLDSRSEGGLNLNMPPEVISALKDYGQQAGDLLMEQFDMDAQRITRAQALFPPLEDALAALSAVYDDDYRDLLINRGSHRSRAWNTDVLAAFGTDLAAIGEAARTLRDDPAKTSIRQGKLVNADAEVRLVAVEDRTPRRVS